MTLRDYEVKLKQANPNLRIKRAGWGAMGLYHKNEYVCRIADCEITPYTVLKKETGQDVNREKGLNSLGSYTWQRIVQRGRRDIATILYQRKLISHLDKAKLS